VNLAGEINIKPCLGNMDHLITKDRDTKRKKSMISTPTPDGPARKKISVIGVRQSRWGGHGDIRRTLHRNLHPSPKKFSQHPDPGTKKKIRALRAV
jgi:hypothetical protein